MRTPKVRLRRARVPAAANLPSRSEPTPRDLDSTAIPIEIWYRYQPPCECEICMRQYRTEDEQKCVARHYVGRTKDPASCAQSLTRSIKEDRQLLYHTVVTSGTALLKRWRASAAKREEYLVEAQPNIYPSSQPFIDIATSAETLAEVHKLRNALLLPYVNIEDLAKDSASFIRLLHHRTTVPPQAWVNFDNAQLQPGWKQGGLALECAEGCIMLQGDQYGTWQEFNSLAIHRGHAYGAIRGLLILEAQKNLMAFLRRMVATILKDASISNEQASLPEASNRGLTSVAFPDFDLTSCKKWMRFVEAEPHRDRAWLSAASFYSQQPFSAPPHFDIDTLIEIAETRAMEAADELWLLQTNLASFHNLKKRHEREWLDSIPGMQEPETLDPKEKMANICYIMTVPLAIHTRDWQWILEECREVKRMMEQTEAKTLTGDVLPVQYERALCGLQFLLRKAQKGYQKGLEALFVKSRAFQSILDVTPIGKDRANIWGLSFDFKDKSKLHDDDRIGWCIYNLTQDAKDMFTIEHASVLQHLENYLETCPQQEIDRIDQEMYKCISNLAAVVRMCSILNLHRPNVAFMAQNPMHQSSQTWRFYSQLLKKPPHSSPASMDLGSALESSARFRMPTGRRDEQWLLERDKAQQTLNVIWEKARHAYQMFLKESDIPQELIEPQLAMMNQGDSPENNARLDLERQDILSRIQAAKHKALAMTPTDAADTFTADCIQPAYRAEETTKQKTKTRPDGPPTSQSLNDEYANLNVDDKVDRSEKPLPVLYTLKQNSIEYQVISRMFPDWSEGMEDGRKTIDWRHFVSTMHILGFRAEHHGGSAFTFKGAIKLPNNLSTLHTKSIVVHRPHPRPEMGPTLLQAVGKCCNKRFGWERANFADKASDEGQGA